MTTQTKSQRLAGDVELVIEVPLDTKSITILAIKLGFQWSGLRGKWIADAAQAAIAKHGGGV